MTNNSKRTIAEKLIAQGWPILSARRMMAQMKEMEAESSDNHPKTEEQSSDVSDSSQAISDTPQTDRYVEHCNGCDMVHVKVSRELEKKLSAAHVEIEATRTLLTRAVGIAEGMSWRYSKWDKELEKLNDLNIAEGMSWRYSKWDKELEKLNDLKSEIAVLGISMEDWYGGFTKIEKICQESKKE